MRRRGFALLEVLVATAIIASLAAAALAALGTLTARWTGYAGEASAAAAGRVALDLVAADLEAAQFVLIRELPPETSGLWEPAPVGAGPGSSLRLITHVRGLENAGNEAAAEVHSAPAAVGYQVIRRRIAEGVAPARYLHRTVVRRAGVSGRPGTLEAGLNLDPGALTPYDEPSAGNDGSSASDPYSVRHPRSADTVVADNVVSLEIVPGAGSCEIRLRMLSPSGATLIGRIEAGRAGLRPARFASDADWWTEVANRNSIVLRRRTCALPGTIH